jgi:hypothetical protein
MESSEDMEIPTMSVGDIMRAPEPEAPVEPAPEMDDPVDVVGKAADAPAETPPPVPAMPVEPSSDDPDLRTPLRPEALGLGSGLMEDLLLRRAVLDGRVPMTQLADRLHVSMNVVDQLVTSLRDRKLVEFDGMEGRVYVVAVTDAGRAHTKDRSR